MQLTASSIAKYVTMRSNHRDEVHLRRKISSGTLRQRNQARAELNDPIRKAKVAEKSRETAVKVAQSFLATTGRNVDLDVFPESREKTLRDPQDLARGGTGAQDKSEGHIQMREHLEKLRLESVEHYKRMRDAYRREQDLKLRLVGADSREALRVRGMLRKVHEQKLKERQHQVDLARNRMGKKSSSEPNVSFPFSSKERLEKLRKTSVDKYRAMRDRHHSKTQLNQKLQSSVDWQQAQAMRKELREFNQAGLPNGSQSASSLSAKAKLRLRALRDASVRSFVSKRLEYLDELQRQARRVESVHSLSRSSAARSVMNYVVREKDLSDSHGDTEHKVPPPANIAPIMDQPRLESMPANTGSTSAERRRAGETALPWPQYETILNDDLLVTVEIDDQPHFSNRHNPAQYQAMFEEVSECIEQALAGVKCLRFKIQLIQRAPRQLADLTDLCDFLTAPPLREGPLALRQGPGRLKECWVAIKGPYLMWWEHLDEASAEESSQVNGPDGAVDLRHVRRAITCSDRGFLVRPENSSALHLCARDDADPGDIEEWCELLEDFREEIKEWEEEPPSRRTNPSHTKKAARPFSTHLRSSVGMAGIGGATGRWVDRRHGNRTAGADGGSNVRNAEDKRRAGAFEVQAAVRSRDVVKTTLLFSKLKRHCWPAPKLVGLKLVDWLASLGFKVHEPVFILSTTPRLGEEVQELVETLESEGIRAYAHHLGGHNGGTEDEDGDGGSDSVLRTRVAQDKLRAAKFTVVVGKLDQGPRGTLAAAKAAGFQLPRQRGTIAQTLVYHPYLLPAKNQPETDGTEDKRRNPVLYWARGAKIPPKLLAAVLKRVRPSTHSSDPPSSTPSSPAQPFGDLVLRSPSSPPCAPLGDMASPEAVRGEAPGGGEMLVSQNVLLEDTWVVNENNSRVSQALEKEEPEEKDTGAATEFRRAVDGSEKMD